MPEAGETSREVVHKLAEMKGRGKPRASRFAAVIEVIDAVILAIGQRFESRGIREALIILAIGMPAFSLGKLVLLPRF